MFCLSACFFIGCSLEKEFQNQYLEVFELDFIDTTVTGTVDNKYGVYFEIELNDEENEQFEKFAKERNDIFHTVGSDLYRDIYKNISTKTNLLNKNVQFLEDGYYSYYDYENDIYNSLENETDHFVFFEYSKGIVYLFRLR